MNTLRTSFVATLALLAAPALPATEGEHDFMHHIYDYIEDLSVFELGQEDSRAYYIPEHSQLLNGQWRFFFADTPEGIPTDFYQPSFADRKWTTIDVPSNWEMRGFGDPLFRNVAAPFKANPPLVPHEYNPTGAYRTTFTVPSDWSGEEVFLRFEKVASASFLWVNGHEVGYNEGAQEPAEYDITPYLQKGRNTLAMLVIKYSDGYYLEGQDYWRLAGIFDDVWLYATPRTRLFDWHVTTDLDADYRDAELCIQATAKHYGEGSLPQGLTLRAQLFDDQNHLVTDLAADGLTLAQPVSNPRKWTSETPDLYHLHMQLCDASGQVLDRAEQTVGFKETEIRDNVFLLNGQPIKVNAQNSHMQHPRDGHSVTDALIVQDMTILKQYGFNAVRTSHYPPVPRYLEYAAQYGLYIIDETGDESHATEYVCNDPRFTEMYRERVRRMVLRDRNQPAVLFWSAGNESGEGFNIAEVIKEGRQYDDTRSWMYGGNAYSHPAEEIIGPRYPTPLALDLKVGHHQDGDVRPSFMDEYISVAGNGGGFLDEMWQAVYQYPRTIGGALWDFVSPGLYANARALTDQSPLHNPAHIMGNAKLVEYNAISFKNFAHTYAEPDKGRTRHNHVLDLNGHDQWVEVYRSPALDLETEALTIGFDVMPRALNASSGTFITKGSYQYGVQQYGADSLLFYINTDKDINNPRARSHRYQLFAPLPDQWTDQWHSILALYDGKEMLLLINGIPVTKAPAAGHLINAPYPVNIGRNAEIHGQQTDVYLCDALLDNVFIYGEAVLNFPLLSLDSALLSLDFEQETPGPEYFTYGIGARTYGTIWPDRSVQPEAIQMKHSTRPIVITLLNAESGTAEVWNRSAFLPASHYATTWTLLEDGVAIEQGELAWSESPNSQQTQDVAPLSRQLVHIPYHKPTIKPGSDYQLQFSTRLKQDERWAPAGHEVAADQAALPWHQLAEASDRTIGTAHLEQTAEAICVTGDGFCYTFTPDGQLTGIEQQGTQLLAEPLQLNIWRAPIACEVDDWSAYNIRYSNNEPWTGRQISAEWWGNHLDRTTRMPISCEAREVDGQVYLDVRCFTQFGEVKFGALDAYIFGIRYQGLEETYRYRINGDGTIALHHTIKPEGQMPYLLPRIGLTLSLNKDMQQVDWYGRGPEENYPDRKTGYMVGRYHTTVDDMYEPYLIPQDHGLRCDLRWLTLSDGAGHGLQFSMNELFNFNAYPFSTDHLTRAVYQYQLQRGDAITLNLDYATTGLGCTANYVLPAYQVKPQMYERDITIRLR